MHKEDENKETALTVCARRAKRKDARVLVVP